MTTETINWKKPGRIKGLRMLLRKTQTGLADLIGVSRGIVTHWEAGTKHPSMKSQQKLDELAIDFGEKKIDAAVRN